MARPNVYSFARYQFRGGDSRAIEQIYLAFLAEHNAKIRRDFETSKSLMLISLNSLMGNINCEEQITISLVRLLLLASTMRRRCYIALYI